MIMALLIVQVAFAIAECKRKMVVSEMPCIQISAWRYPKPCNTYTVQIYNEVPTLIQNLTMGEYGGLAKKCNVTLDLEKGGYFLNFSSGDTAIINVEEDADMILGLVIGVGIISALLLFFAFKLDDEHIILKLLFMISSITLLILIPVSTFITTTENAGKIFYKLFLYIFVAFWIYIFIYFCYWILRKLGWIVPGGEENEDE